MVYEPQSFSDAEADTCSLKIHTSATLAICALTVIVFPVFTTITDSPYISCSFHLLPCLLFILPCNSCCITVMEGSLYKQLVSQRKWLVDIWLIIWQGKCSTALSPKLINELGKIVFLLSSRWTVQYHLWILVYIKRWVTESCWTSLQTVQCSVLPLLPRHLDSLLCCTIDVERHFQHNCKTNQLQFMLQITGGKA